MFESNWAYVITMVKFDLCTMVTLEILLDVGFFGIMPRHLARH
jgi:hypothetical protein